MINSKFMHKFLEFTCKTTPYTSLAPFILNGHMPDMPWLC